MLYVCKFCLFPNGNHSANCAQDTPNADALYSEGWRHGYNSAIAQQPSSAAYMAGYLAGYQGSYWWDWELLN